MKGRVAIMKFETTVLHNKNKKSSNIKSKVTPIYQTSAFVFEDLDELEGFYSGNGNYLYTRTGNPNTDELGEAVARLEGAPMGVATSSGISAILVAILTIAKSGDHIIAAEDIYGGSFYLIEKELTQLGIEVTIVPFDDLKKIESSIQDNTKILYSESITNPLLRVENIDALIDLAKQKNLYTIIDNTFATPLHCRPYVKGVDLVLHSATKYIGGHSDVTSGVVVGSEELMTIAKGKVTNLGVNLSPFESWLTCRGLKTISLRMKEQSSNAQKLADAFLKREEVKRVYYPFDHGENGFGAMVSIELAENLDPYAFFKSLGWIKIVPTLAGVETTVSHPLKTSHRALTKEAQAELGINESLVRISVGIEAAEDIIEQFFSALQEAKKE